MKLKLMTYNIQHGLDYDRRTADDTDRAIDLAKIAGVIKNLGGQIVALNEVRDYAGGGDSEAQAKKLGDALGYESYFARAIEFKQGDLYGNALLSAFPIKTAKTVLIPDPAVRDEDAYYETRCVLHAEIDVPGGLTALVCHFGLSKKEQDNAVETLLAEIASTEGPLVLMGDFNVTPDDPRIARLAEKLYDTGALLPAGTLSFPSDKPEIKIDYIFTRGIDVISAEIPAVTASDHRPYTADAVI